MPDWKEEILGRLRALKLAPVREAEIIEEVAQHLEDRYTELVADGASEEDAHRAALQELSCENVLACGLRQVEREVRQEHMVPGAQGGGNLLAGIAQDIRYGLRTLRKNPSFTGVAVLTLALGIGANTAIFTVINAVLLRPLPFPNPEQLVTLFERDLKMGYDQNAPAAANYLDWRAQNNVFTRMAAYGGGGQYNVTGSQRPERVAGAAVTADLFPLLGISPLLGRTFSTEEERPGRA